MSKPVIPPSFSKPLLFCLKLFLVSGIFVFLFWQASVATDADGKNVFAVLWEQPKRWNLILFAFFAQLFAVCVTFWRWKMLLQTLGLQCSVKDAFRLGFLGLTLNLAPMGIVGGDMIKAILLANKNPALKTEAFASVIVDRIIGLLVMFLCGTVFVLLAGFAFRQELLARTFSHIVFALTTAGFAGVGIVFLPFFSKGHLERFIEKIPLCGRIGSELTRSLLLYRNHKTCLLKSFAVTFCVHISFGFSLYWIAQGLFSSVPNLLDHLMLYCVVNLTSMIPLAAGPFELVMEQLYQLFGMGIGTGLVVALGFRFIAIAVAALGIGSYLYCRHETL